MKKTNTTPLAIEEHRRLGTTLTMIRNELGSAERLNQFKKGSTTHRYMRRAEKVIDSLRCKLDSLVCKQYPNFETRPIYYGNPTHPREDYPAEALKLCLDHAVGDVINGRVPVAIIDQYIRGHHALHSLHIVMEDYPEDRRAA
jgi:hypothetical protein